MRAVQCWCLDILKEGVIGFRKVYYCKVLFIKSDEPVYSGELQKEVNFRMKLTIEGDSEKHSEDSSFYVPVENCDEEGMFKSIQSVAKQLEQVRKELISRNPGGEFEELKREIRFLSGIKKESLFVAE